jgi:peptide/nickel transport system substrate-binding protein
MRKITSGNAAADRETLMRQKLLGSVTASVLLAASLVSGAAFAQKPGGTLQMSGFASPASMSIHEESTIAAGMPLMGLFNNLVLFDQHVAQNSLASIVPDLASDWASDEAGTALIFHLRQGVKWHDGKPFTAADVKCTWDALAGKASEKFRVNPRKSWYGNLDEVTTNGDYEVTFHLKRPQPYLIALLASGQSPVYPCHVPLREMRSHPIGTGPFKFVEYKPNEHIRVVRNPDYWKPGRPYLDGIETTIIPNVSTRLMAFVAGKFDFIQPTIPQLKDVLAQSPQAHCDVVMDNNSRDLLINRTKPPFDDIELRRAMALSLDRQAFIDILAEGQGAVGGAILPPPDGVWGMPPDVLHKLPGYGPDAAKNRTEARDIMQKLGYGPNKSLAVKVSTRDTAAYRDAAVIAISQLREVYIDGELEPIDTANWFPRVIRKDYTVGVTVSEGGLDEPDQKFYETYVCGADRNYTGYCNDETNRLIDRQSAEADPYKRRKLVWEVERKLAEDASRPVLLYSRFATCMQPRLKGLTTVTNSRFNGWRMEDVWLDR